MESQIEGSSVYTGTWQGRRGGEFREQRIDGLRERMGSRERAGRGALAMTQ